MPESSQEAVTGFDADSAARESVAISLKMAMLARKLERIQSDIPKEERIPYSRSLGRLSCENSEDVATGSEPAGPTMGEVTWELHSAVASAAMRDNTLPTARIALEQAYIEGQLESGKGE